MLTKDNFCVKSELDISLFAILSLLPFQIRDSLLLVLRYYTCIYLRITFVVKSCVEYRNRPEIREICN